VYIKVRRYNVLKQIKAIEKPIAFY